MKTIVKTVALVTFFSCFERFLGFVYRIFLSHKLGAEGIGMYQITLSVAGVLVTLTASGTPITVSRLMMKFKTIGNKTAERQVVSAGILTSLILSLPITLVLYFFRSKLCFIFADPYCYDILIVILPGIVITSVYAVLRGVFWGNKSFFTYSMIELIEEIVMLVFGVFLVSRMTSVADGAIRGGYAILISYVVSFSLATIVFICQGGKLANPFKQLPSLVEASLPITLMRTATSLLGSLVSIIIPSRLMACGYTSSEALSRFGELSGMALPLLFIPSTIIGSIALVLVPELSKNYYERETKQLTSKISKAINCSAVISAFIFPVFIGLGREIGTLVYSNENSGIMLAFSAIMMLPMSITMITTSVLNSLNRERKTLLFYIFGALFTLASSWFLPKYFGVYALIIGHLGSYIITSILNLTLLEKTFKYQLCYKMNTLKVFLASTFSSLLGFFSRNILSSHLNTIALIFVVTAIIFVANAIIMQTVGIINIPQLFKRKDNADIRDKNDKKQKLTQFKLTNKKNSV